MLMSTRRLSEGLVFFVDQPLQEKPVHYSAGITHLVQHALADDQGGKWLWMTATEDPEDIELLQGNVFSGKKIPDFFGKPIVGENQVDDEFLVFAGKMLLLDVFF
jgi:hypothetical protein